MDCVNEWQVVGRRKGPARRVKPSAAHLPYHEQPTDSSRDKQRILDALNELKVEDFWLDWRRLLTGCLSEHDAGSSRDDEGVRSERQLDCVCYGLGSFSSCVSARYQLAMLLLLLDTLQVPVDQCCLYDPVFSRSECETLREFGFTVLTENEEGKRAVCRPTVFYLMHCGKALYNNLLWRNWSPQTLPNIIVIGNSFHGIQERMLQRELQRDYSFLSDVMPICEETVLPCSQRFADVFNDTALIRFLPENLKKLPETTWAQAAEPQYQHCQDLEIIQRGKN